eukprot:CAMPEP_0176405880 /NCGR_PEP_ID=MMETSP0127-20121128/578_1 /TAXON_ID=938130 /ORGANISM="Platyophrya macrostoma, Strain WH" /LENGTH=384 /DNA_ID=CAMNT_0017784977 /DNA_START=120 /DNA_END=1274 /DNA_ORIENTATION=-
MVSDKMHEARIRAEQAADEADAAEAAARQRDLATGSGLDAYVRRWKQSAASGGATDSSASHAASAIPQERLIAPRSSLFVPCANPKALKKVQTPVLDDVDLFILDLEDSVPPHKKKEARDALVRFVADEKGLDHSSDANTSESPASAGRRRAIVRINSLTSDMKNAMLDLEAIYGSGVANYIEGIALPKITLRDKELLQDYLGETHTVWAFFETPQSILEADVICAQRGFHFAAMGLNDLANELGLPLGLRGPRVQFYYAMSRVIAAARANGIVPIDGVFNDPTDTTGLRAELEECRRFGFDGKTLIHPSQVKPCNGAFTPTEEEVRWAQRIVQATSEAGGGVAVVDGKMVEELHARQAKRLLMRKQLAEAQLVASAPAAAAPN